jgi:hypothetical protein
MIVVLRRGPSKETFAARKIQAQSNSNGLRTKSTFGHPLSMLAFVENGGALKPLTRLAAAKSWRHW